MNNKLFNGPRCSSSKYYNLNDYSKETRKVCLLYAESKRHIYVCFFIYSCKAFSSSSLIFRVEPVLFTTNFIHSVHVCLSIFMDVFVFSSISLAIPCAVNKVSGLYHNLNKGGYGIMVWRYRGSGTELVLFRVLLEHGQVEL